jgi:hypothetical protein
MMTRFTVVALVFGLQAFASRLDAGDEALRQQAAQGLRKASEFFRSQVATEGGYLWRYSEDLARREGEGKASATEAWVQPPGTPSVGLAYLQAYLATKDHDYLEAARATAGALIRGQLRSGGWDYRIEFDPAKRGKVAYRVEPGSEKGRNVTTLDDNNTQAALRLLMRVDMALARKDKELHDATVYGLQCLLKAQYPNGAWPQRYDAFPDAAKFPIAKARYPESWSITYPAQDYRGYYTLNDNSIADVVDVLFEASRLYGEPAYRQAAQRAGDFLILAQLPEPQPAWAQQYDTAMQPAWARKFEPPAVTGGESRGAVQTLLRIYQETGDRKYLEPIPRALAYLRRSVLPDGRLARFYELQTNRPLYFTKDYKLTYSDADVPTHYGFKVGNWVETQARAYERISKLDAGELRKKTEKPRGKASAALVAQVKEVLAALDEGGRWVDSGRLRSHGPDDPTRRVIQTQTFIRNVGVLSGFLASR